MPFGGSSDHTAYPDLALADAVDVPPPFSLIYHLATVPRLIDDWTNLPSIPPCPKSVGGLRSLSRRCQQSDDGIRQWSQHTPGPWPAEVHRSAQIRMEETYTRTDRYTDVIIARSYNYARAARMFLHSIMLRCALVNQESSMQTPAEHQQIILNLVEDICASVPFHLGRCVDYERRACHHIHRSLNKAWTDLVFFANQQQGGTIYHAKQNHSPLKPRLLTTPLPGTCCLPIYSLRERLASILHEPSSQVDAAQRAVDTQSRQDDSGSWSMSALSRAVQCVRTDRSPLAIPAPTRRFIYFAALVRSYPAARNLAMQQHLLELLRSSDVLMAKVAAS